MKRALLYFGLLTILSAIFILHNHIISAPQPTSRGIGLIIIGAALGITATLFQGYFKNNLADSGLMGLTTGAALGSIISLRIGNEFGSRDGIMISVFFCIYNFLSL